MLVLLVLLRGARVKVHGMKAILFLLREPLKSFSTNEESENGKEMSQFP